METTLALPLFLFGMHSGVCFYTKEGLLVKPCLSEVVYISDVIPVPALTLAALVCS